MTETAALYERTIDEIELAVMAAEVSDDEKLTALVEVMCRVLADQDLIPDPKLFAIMAQWMPRRVATLILESQASHG